LVKAMPVFGLTTTTAFGATDLLEGVVVLLLQDFQVKTLLLWAGGDGITDVASYL